MSQFVDFKDKRIAFTQEGNGPALVLLHGFLENKQMWKRFADFLKEDFQIIAIDLPGFGESDVFGDCHTMDFMAEAVKAVLDQLDIKECVVAGHSMGGYTALAFGENYPEMLKGLCLFHSHASEDPEEVKQNRLRTIDIVNKDRTGFITHFIPDLFAPDNRAYFAAQIDELKKRAIEHPAQGITAALAGMKERPSRVNFLSQTKAPVLFIAGKQDSRIPLNKVMAQAMLPQHAEMLILGQVGHMGWLEDEYNTIHNLRCFAYKALI